MFALLFGVGLAVWLLIQPPGGEGNAPQASTLITPTAAVQVQTTPQAGTPGASGTAAPNQTARPNATATTAPSGGGNGTYTVVAGDSLSSICSRVKPASMSVNECVENIVSLNSLANADDISVGDTLRTPQ
jgi:Tfp pilus assembly protein FimV